MFGLVALVRRKKTGRIAFLAVAQVGALGAAWELGQMAAHFTLELVALLAARALMVLFPAEAAEAALQSVM